MELKNYLFPLFMKEIDAVSQKYTGMYKKSILKYSNIH